MPSLISALSVRGGVGPGIAGEGSRTGKGCGLHVLLLPSFSFVFKGMACLPAVTLIPVHLLPQQSFGQHK